MNIISVINMIGGLAFFLYGMQVMGKGLESLSGGKLETVLEKMTDTKLKSVLLGAGVTALIQSSSAITAMVVGFVNSGIMELGRAISVIMGSNVGTTLTAWILSLAGIEGDSLFVELLKPTTFAPVFAIIGVLISMFSKNEKKLNTATILVGFAVLMFGMSTMSSAMSPLGDDPNFTGLFTKFSNPILGIIAGALLTAVIQSSSASVGILQALSLSGSVTMASAFPIILGQNIGTCITALISCIGTNKNAKRTALAHLYFNVIGVVIISVLYYGTNAIFHFSFMKQQATPVSIAVIHSFFNILSTVIIFPFSGVLEKLARYSVKEGKNDTDELSLLDDHFLITPSFALEKCKEVTVTMAKLSQKSVALIISLLKNYSEETAKGIKANEKEIDRYEEELEDYLVQISSMNLNSDDSVRISLLHHAVGNFEKIGDYCEDILKSKKVMIEKNVGFSDQAKYELSVLISAIKTILEKTIEAFEHNDVDIAKEVEPYEEMIDQLQKELKSRHLKRLEDSHCTIEQGFLFLDIVNSFERIADHCSNMAVSIIELSQGSYNIHTYMKAIKTDLNNEYFSALDRHIEDYSLN